MSDLKPSEYTYNCLICGISTTKMVSLNASNTILPLYCSKTCKGTAKRRRDKQTKAETKAQLAAMPTLDPTRGMSKAEKNLYRLMQENKRETTQRVNTYDESAYRTSGGYKPRKLETTSRPRSEFEVVCPHPYKLAYRTEEEAQAFIDTTFPDEEFLAPYKCMCGGMHIGHSYPRSHPLHPANRRYVERHAGL